MVSFLGAMKRLSENTAGRKKWISDFQNIWSGKVPISNLKHCSSLVGFSKIAGFFNKNWIFFTEVADNSIATKITKAVG
jgi:hypothetical protein